MSKLNLKFVFISLLFLTFLVQAATAQEPSAENPLAFLKQLVGEKCQVHLKNGETINGTLWVYGNDYVSVKVKKGLLYSKTEKYYVSEIDFIKDKAANRYYMPGVVGGIIEKSQKKLLINPDLSYEKEEAKLEQEFQGILRFSSKEKERKESYTAPPPASKTTYNMTKPPVAKKTKTALNKKTEKPGTALSYKTEEPKTTTATLDSSRSKTTKEARKSAKPTYFTKRTPPASKTTYNMTKPPVAKKTKTALNKKTEKPGTALSYKTEEPKTTTPTLDSSKSKTTKEARKPAKPTYFNKRTPAKTQNIEKSKTELSKKREKLPQEKEVKIAAAEYNSKNAPAFWNQKFVLVGSGALIIAALLLFKFVRARYRKQSLFPTRVIEIHGKHAVIDHGITDGIKIDDFIRLYKKTGRKIQYKGKIKVQKVGENYSAVELVKLQPDQHLEINDVGFRDRNLFVAAVKRFRIITSASLRGLAKVLQFTAKNIDVKSDEPSVDLRPAPEKQNKDVRTVVPQNQRVVKVTPGPVTTVESSFTSKAWGFDDLI